MLRRGIPPYLADLAQKPKGGKMGSSSPEIVTTLGLAATSGGGHVEQTNGARHDSGFPVLRPKALGLS